MTESTVSDTPENLLMSRRRIGRHCYGFLLIMLLMVTQGPVRAEETTSLLSVSEILATLSDTIPSSGDDTALRNPEADLRAHLELYRQEAPSLSDDAASERWVSLLKEYIHLPPAGMTNTGVNSTPFSIEMIWDVLPAPSAWPWIAAATAEDSAAGPATGPAMSMENDARIIRMIGSALTNDQAGVWREIKPEAERSLSLPAQQRQFGQYALGPLLDATIAGCDDPDSLAEALDLRLRVLEARQDASTGYYENIALPDLVAILGEERADSFIRRALRLPFPLTISMGVETRRLAIRLAMQADSSDLGAPQWGLAASPDGFELYERTDVLFPRQESNWNRGQAQAFYVFGLIERGRSAEAKAMMKEFQNKEFAFYEAIEALKRAGRGDQARLMLHELLAENPGLGLWDMYAGLASAEGRGEEIIALAKSALEDSRVLPHRIDVAKNLLSALFEADRMDDARKIVAMVVAWSEAPPDSSTEEAYSRGNAASGDMISFATQAMAAGDLLNDSFLVENAFHIMWASVASAGQQPGDFMMRYHRQALVKALLDHHRLAEAQGDIVSAMRVREAAREEARRTLGASANNLPQSNDDALALATIYHRAGLWQEVIALFDTAALWRDTDAGFVLLESPLGNEPAGYFLAAALIQAGRPAQALRVTQALLERKPSCDSAYALLLQLDPPDLLTRLDALSVRDRFEERPYIWRAIALLRRGELAAAETAALMAIALDPTDGDQEAGHRILAYATMRDIKSALGDTQAASVYAGIVRAVRDAEEADRWRGAGLTARAMQLYTEALGSFADAYCIHARMAVQFARAGRTEEAADHFRRAFELIPGQIGRMESLCFGCENVFGGEMAAAVADSVFTRLRRENPANPRTAYLLGYLREEQGRYTEALEEYRAAVRLDSDYLSAWRRIMELKDKIWISNAEKRDAVLQIYRLDPSGNHVATNLDSVNDPKIVWALAEKRANAARFGGDVYSLHTANRAESLAGQNGIRPELPFGYPGAPPQSPRSAVRSLPLLRAISAWIDAERSRRTMHSMMLRAVIY